MSSSIYFQFLAAVWDQLPEHDRQIFAETWQGYEQVLAAVYQQQLELGLNISVANLQPYATERWLPYTFNGDNFVDKTASYVATQDLSVGMNLTKKYRLKLGVNGGTPYEFDIVGVDQRLVKIDEIVNKINLVFGFPFAGTVYENTVIKLTSLLVGISSSIDFYKTTPEDVNACEFIFGIDPQDLPISFPEFRYPYILPYSKVANIPAFRSNIRDESVTLTLEEGTDYVVEETGTVSFKSVPPEMLWAERTNINKDTPWYNYGFLTGIYQANSPRYVQVIQGLWFALWNGPKPSNVRIALYLLFGLPVSPVDGVVTTLTTTTIEVTGADGTVYPFTVPSGLEADPGLTLGGATYQFQPLVTGISVYDKISYPGFVETEIGREGIQRFLTEDATRGYGDTDETKALTMLEEYTFLPQISVDSFIYPDINLGNVKIFLNAFRPLNKTYFFQIIVGNFRELLGLTDRIGIHDSMDLTSNLDSNETTYQLEDTLDTYETTPAEGLDLDQEVIVFEERVEVEVYEQYGTFPVLTDSFVA
jgi:hypothetical protein